MRSGIRSNTSGRPRKLEHLGTRRIAGKEHRGQEAACLVIPKNSRDRKMHVLEHLGNSLDRGVGLETPRNSLDKNRSA
jgi:hypothetical protein